MIVGVSDTDPGKPLLHICYAPADDAWVHGRMVHELGLKDGQYRTRADDGLGELQLHEIARAVEECRFTVLIASSAARWDKLAQFAAGLAQHAGLAHTHETPRLVIVARDFALGSVAERAQLPLEQRALVGLDCSDEAHTVEALARLRQILALETPTRPATATKRLHAATPVAPMAREPATGANSRPRPRTVTSTSRTIR